VQVGAAGESVEDGANGERAAAAGAKRAPGVAAIAATAIAAGAHGGERTAAAAVNFYVLYIYICQQQIQAKKELLHPSRVERVIQRHQIWDPMPSALILAVKGGAWENRPAAPRDLPLTKVAPPPPLAMPIIMVAMEAHFLLSQVIR